MKKYLAEMIGTMVLVLMGCGSAVFAGSAAGAVSAGVGTLGVAFAFGLSVVAMVISYFRRFLCSQNTPYKYYLLSAFIILTMFTFSVRMHERYIFPGIVLLVFLLIYFYYIIGKYCLVHSFPEKS